MSEPTYCDHCGKNRAERWYLDYDFYGVAFAVWLCLECIKSISEQPAEKEGRS